MAKTFKPTKRMQLAARRGLAQRQKATPSSRGGTAVGLARARQFSSGQGVSLDTVKRTFSFLSRHKKNYKPGTNTPGTQAYNLWGGPAGLSWARRILGK
jgi:hypothetical protein